MKRGNKIAFQIALMLIGLGCHIANTIKHEDNLFITANIWLAASIIIACTPAEKD